MLSRLFSKFMKKNEDNNDRRDGNYYKNDMANLLGIKCPPIEVYPVLYQTPEGATYSIPYFNEKELTGDMHIIGGYYHPEKNIIFLGSVIPHHDYYANEAHFIPKKEAEMICTLAHELRHIWQKKFHYDTYFKTNAVGEEVINDISEIDADGFALAYVLSDRTPFTYSDMPALGEDLVLQATLDGGKRWAKAHELATEYGLKNTDKIDALAANTDKEKINFMIALLKLQGMI